MTAYSALARHYDDLTADVRYEKWCGYLLRIFEKFGAKPDLILDLACGTGSISCLLAKKGFEMIGVDASEEMLSVAYEKCRELENPPVWVLQDMRKLDLYGTVSAAISCLDSLNYLTRPSDLLKVFSRVSLFMEPSGLFVFDLNTQDKLKKIDGQSFLRQTDSVFCVWQAVYKDRTKTCRYDFDIFEKNRKGDWTRYQETHGERAYSSEEIKELLETSGFELLKIYPELSFGRVKGGEDRLFFVARKK